MAVQSGATPQLVQVGSPKNATAVSVSYRFGNQLSLTNPLEGGGAAVGATWGLKDFGGDANYYQVSLGGSWVFKLHPSHLLAVRGLWGTSGPESIPSQLRYFLGGVYAIRGLASDDDQFKGRNIFLSSVEYRHLLVPDIDINCWLFRIRDIQGAIFADAGRVTDTVQEQANRIAFGPTTAENLTSGCL